MITEFTVENFKSYRRPTTLPLGPLTLLVGANASGKTNLLEALHVLSQLADGQRLADLFLDVVRTDEVRGRVTDMLYHAGGHPKPDQGELAFGCTLDGTNWPEFSARIRVDAEDARVVDERMESPDEIVPLYEVREPAPEHRHEVKVAYNNFAKGGKKPTIFCSDRRAVFTQLDIASRFQREASQTVIPATVEAFSQTLRDIAFYDFEPAAMRFYSSRADGETLDENGSNLSSVLYHLTRVQDERGTERVLEFIRDLPEQQIEGIEFHATPRAEVMLRLGESFGGPVEYRDAPVLSDGTLRVLAIAAAILSAPKGALVVMEEIDNGVHPSRAANLLASIRRVAEERDLSVLLTSHNPAIADAMPDAAVPDIVACYRDPDEGDSRLVRLNDLVEYPELVARASIGRLMTSRVLERTLHQQQSEEERLAEVQRETADLIARLGART